MVGDSAGMTNNKLIVDRSRVESDLRWLCYFVSCRPCITIPSFPASCRHMTRSEHDQELDSLLVGPVPVGVNKFIFEADSPNLKRIPDSEILGVTVILLSCSYDDREFVRVGYYVNNEYDSEEMNAEPPSRVDIKRVRRNVLAEKPRVTRFAIKWCVGNYLLRHCSRTDSLQGYGRLCPCPISSRSARSRCGH